MKSRPILFAASMLVASSGAAAATPLVLLEQLPRLEDTARAYPPAAVEGNFGGRVTLRCVVLAEGKAGDCAVVSETPEGLGFSAAALTLQSLILANPEIASGTVVEPPIEFLPRRPATAVFKRDRQRPQFPAVGPYYPIVAADAGVTGRAMIACVRGLKGELDDCRVLAEAPKTSSSARPPCEWRRSAGLPSRLATMAELRSANRWWC